MKAREVKGLDPRGPLGPNVSRIVRVRLDELRDLAELALTPDAGRAQHDMRIAAKRLRYVLELFVPCFGEEANEARLAAKRLQSVLGDLHDCDLMLPKVEQVEPLATVFRARRELLYQRFVDLWQADVNKGTWSTLEAAL
jgi:CHAD domain-containing protein